MQEKNASDWDLQRGLGGLGYTALSSGDPALAVDSAAGTINGVLDYYETSPFRFDRARTRLIAGRILWRARARRTARDLVASATGDFTAFRRHRLG
jgi:hypothetical protein